MTKIVTISIYVINDDLPESKAEELYERARKRFEAKFKGKIRESFMAEVFSGQYEVVDWPDYEADLLEYSQGLPVGFAINEISMSNLENGLKVETLT